MAPQFADPERIGPSVSLPGPVLKLAYMERSIQWLAASRNEETSWHPLEPDAPRPPFLVDFLSQACASVLRVQPEPLLISQERIRRWRPTMHSSSVPDYVEGAAKPAGHACR